MKDACIGRRAAVLAAALLGGLLLFSGAVSGSVIDSFSPYNQAYTGNLFKETTYLGWSNQVNISDYQDMSWFRQPARNSLFNQTDFGAFAPIDSSTQKMMDNALKNFLTKKTKFTSLSSGPSYIWCNGGY